MLQSSPDSLGMPRGERMLLLEELLISAGISSIVRQHSLTTVVQMLCSFLLMCCLSIIQLPALSKARVRQGEYSKGKVIPKVIAEQISVA